MGNNNAMTLNSKALLQGKEFFENLTTLKEGEALKITFLTFSSFNGGKDITTHIHIPPANEILMNQFAEDVKVIFHKIISLFDLSCYKDSLVNGKEYNVLQFIIGPNGEEIQVGASFEEFILDGVVECSKDEHTDNVIKELLDEFDVLLEKIKVVCNRMFDRYATVNDKFNNKDIKKVSTSKEKLYNLVSDKLKVPKEDFFKLLDLLDNSLDDSLTGVEQIEHQCEYIKNEFKGMGDKEILSILSAKYNLYRIVFNDDLYIVWEGSGNGGIVECGQDDFECAFMHWLASRGTDFLINYLNHGPYFIMGYLYNNKISKAEYLHDGIYRIFFDAEFITEEEALEEALMEERNKKYNEVLSNKISKDKPLADYSLEEIYNFAEDEMELDDIYEEDECTTGYPF